MNDVLYANDRVLFSNDIHVVYTTEDGTKLVKRFDSPFKARKFANRVKYSKKCNLIATSGFLM